MAAQCRSPRCTAERKGFRRELDSWRHRLIHCVGFESILEGLYGPGLRRDLSLFDDCEPEELVDWYVDDKCSLCNLRKDTIDDCTQSFGSTHSTPTKELISQGQFNTEKIECQAENYLNALFQKKDLPQNCDSNIPLVAQELMKKMIRQFAIEYVSKSQKIHQNFSETMVEPVPNCNGIQLNHIQEEQEGPLDLTVTRIQEHFPQGDDVLDLSIKRKSGAFEETSKRNNVKPGASKFNISPALDKSNDPHQGSTALSNVLNSLCQYHQQQLISMFKYLAEEQKRCSESCYCNSYGAQLKLSKTNEHSPAHPSKSSSSRLRRHCRLKKQPPYLKLPSLSVCVKDLRLICPSLGFGTVNVSSIKNGYSHLQNGDHKLKKMSRKSRGEKRSGSLSADLCPYFGKKKRCGSPLSPPIPAECDLASSKGTWLNSLKSNCNAQSFILPVTNSEKSFNFKSDVSVELMATVQQNNMKRCVEAANVVMRKHCMDCKHKKLKKMHYPERCAISQKIIHNKRLPRTDTFGTVTKHVLKNTKQGEFSFMKLRNRCQNSLETKMCQMKFRKHQEELRPQLKAQNSLSKRQSLQTKSKCNGQIETFANKKASKNSTRNIDRSVCSVNKQECGSSGKSHTVITTQEDNTKLPRYSLRMHSKNVNYSRKDFCLNNYLPVSTIHKHANKKIVSSTNPSNSYCKDDSGKSKYSAVSNQCCCGHSSSKLFFKCTSKEVSGLKNINVKGLKGTDVNFNTHLHVVVERLENSIHFGNKAVNKDVYGEKTGKISNIKIKKVLTKKPETLHVEKSLFLKPLNLRKRNRTMDLQRNREVKNSESASNKEDSTVADNWAKTQPPRFTSPIKLMFVSKVGEKYALSSVDVSLHKNRATQSLNENINCTESKTQDARSTEHCNQFENHDYCQVTFRPSPQPSNTKKNHVTHEHLEPAKNSQILDECVVKRITRRQNNLCSQIQKSLTSLGLPTKSNVPENTDKPTDLTSCIQLFPCSKTNDSEDSVTLVSVNFARSKKAKTPVSENESGTSKVCFKCQKKGPAKNDLSAHNNEVIRSGKISTVMHHSDETSRSSKILLKPQRAAKQKMLVLPMPVEYITLRNRRVGLTNCLSAKRREIITKNSGNQCRKSDRKVYKKRTLNKDKGDKFALLRKNVIPKQNLRSKRLSLTVLHSVASSTTYSFRSPLLHKSNKLSFKKFKKVQKIKKSKRCVLSSGHSTGLERINNGNKGQGLVSDISSECIFQPNTILNWWSSCTSRDSLVQDLDARYKQMTTTWVNVNSIEKDSETCISVSDPCFPRLKMSPVQMLFHKKCDIDTLSTWFMQTTETQSLSIVRKANARSPMKAKTNKRIRQKVAPFMPNCRKHTKYQQMTLSHTSKASEKLSKVVQSNNGKSNEANSEKNYLKSIEGLKINYLHTMDEKSKRASLKSGSNKETLNETSDGLGKVQLKPVLIKPTPIPPIQNCLKDFSPSRDMQLQSALVGGNATGSSRLLKNVQEPNENHTYECINKQNVKDCKVFLRKISATDPKTHTNNHNASVVIANSTARELNKSCKRRSHLDLKNDFEREIFTVQMNRYLAKNIAMRNSVKKKCGQKMCLRKSRRQECTNHRASKMMTFERRRRRYGESSVHEITNKEWKPHYVAGTMQEEFSKLQFGPLRPVGLTSTALRGDSSKLDNYSLTPIRIPLHGNTKHKRNCL